MSSRPLIHYGSLPSSHGSQRLGRRRSGPRHLGGVDRQYLPVGENAGTRCPFSETVFWEETYARVKKSEMPNEMWQKRPRGQLLKCAKAASLRAAFPEETGDYTAEEMAGKVIEADIVQTESVIDALAHGWARGPAARLPAPRTPVGGCPLRTLAIARDRVCKGQPNCRLSHGGETHSASWALNKNSQTEKRRPRLILNESDLMDPSELAGLNDIIEGQPLVIAENGGEVIRPYPKFRVFATGNSVGAGDGSGLDQGVLRQNLAFMDRFRVVHVGYPEPAIEKEIIKTQAPKLPDLIVEKMIAVAGEVRRLFVGAKEGGAELTVTMSTRTVVRWAGLSLTFKGAPKVFEYALTQALTARTEPEQREAIHRIAADVFGDYWEGAVP